MVAGWGGGDGSLFCQFFPACAACPFFHHLIWIKIHADRIGAPYRSMSSGFHTLVGAEKVIQVCIGEGVVIHTRHGVDLRYELGHVGDGDAMWRIVIA